MLHQSDWKAVSKKLKSSPLYSVRWPFQVRESVVSGQRTDNVSYLTWQMNRKWLAALSEQWKFWPVGIFCWHLSLKKLIWNTALIQCYTYLSWLFTTESLSQFQQHVPSLIKSLSLDSHSVLSGGRGWTCWQIGGFGLKKKLHRLLYFCNKRYAFLKIIYQIMNWILWQFWPGFRNLSVLN